MAKNQGGQAVSVREYLEYCCDYAGVGFETVTDRDIALGILALDYESQLVAVHSVLQRNREAEAQASARIRKLEAAIRKHGHPHHWVEHDWVDRMHDQTFLDAAHSMAAVGLIAPVIESLFDRTFRYFGHENKWKQSRRHDIAKGILKLAEAINLKRHLPDDLDRTLLALFAYRNKMFHCGLEWPEKDRRDFANRIRSNGWTNCFSCAESGGDPWCVYLSKEFVDHCLKTVDSVIDGIGAYARPTIWKDDRADL